MQQQINKENIILLPTGKEQHKERVLAKYVHVNKIGWLLSYNKYDTGGDAYIPHYMYITDNSPIIKGDFYYQEDLGAIVKASDVDARIYASKKPLWYKVIGSNDKSLIADGVSSISLEFISRCIEATNSGKEFAIKVEMKVVRPMNCSAAPNITDDIYGYKLSDNNQLILDIVYEKTIRQKLADLSTDKRSSIQRTLERVLDTVGKEKVQEIIDRITAIPVPEEYKQAHSVDTEIEAAFEKIIVKYMQGMPDDSYIHRYRKIWDEAIELYKSRQSIEAVAFAEWIGLTNRQAAYYIGERKTYWLLDNNTGTKITTEQLYQEWLKQTK